MRPRVKLVLPEKVCNYFVVAGELLGSATMLEPIAVQFSAQFRTAEVV